MIPNPYRVAYETALSEITEITAKFEQLRTRKSQIEQLIAALQPVFAAEAASPEPVSTSQASMQQVHQEEMSVPELANTRETTEQANYSYLDVPAPLPEGDGDPFQRRVKTAFRFRGLATQRSY